MLALIVPIVGGVIGGILLGVNELAYLIYSVLAIGAGYFGGLEHVGGEEGALRGFTGGLLFGTFILVAHEVVGVRRRRRTCPSPRCCSWCSPRCWASVLGCARRARSRGKREAARRG